MQNPYTSTTITRALYMPAALLLLLLPNTNPYTPNSLPLLLTAYKDVPFQPLLRGRLDGMAVARPGEIRQLDGRHPPVRQRARLCQVK